MGTKITFYGHATLGVETDGYHLLVDPFFTGNAAAEPLKVDIEKLKADFVLITHGHRDHLGDTVDIVSHNGAKVICNTEIGDWLEKQGVHTHMLQNGGVWNFPFGKVKMTFALHGSDLEGGISGGQAAGFILTTHQDEKLYLAGDTGLFDDMALIGEEGIDLAMLPIGGFYTMDPEDALRAVKLIKPKVVIPIHYNTFDRIRQDAGKWKEKVEAETPTKVVILQPGESYDTAS